MFEKIRKTIWLIRKNGVRYFIMRVVYEIKRRSGILKMQHPVNPAEKIFFTKDEWLKQKGNFFIEDRDNINIYKNRSPQLEKKVQDIFANKLVFFQGQIIDLSNFTQWLQNPSTGFVYNTKKHWTEVADFSPEQGDIKFVWEKSRFCFIYDVMRYDYHFEKDSSKFVLNEIESWIDNNPVNCGPNYVSCQEIALRILNWIYVLQYYKDSEYLNDKLFNKILNSIYFQAKHVSDDISFSKNFVRNNHLLTEALCLFTTGIIFPEFKEAYIWKEKGHEIFSEEILYQFAEDGSYLQHTFNYQRIATQLTTWFLNLCKINNIKVEQNVIARLKSTIYFQHTFIQLQNGRVPNFGNNDGSLFFPLNENGFENYKPQLQALANSLGLKLFEDEFEDTLWFGNSNTNKEYFNVEQQVINEFSSGGYYVLKENGAFTFLWCTDFKYRPSQADNLHLDIWYNGENILRDCGMYMYNAEENLRNYFFGGRSQNTVLVNGYDQMEKGRRFIFYDWTEKNYASLTDENDKYIFKASIKGFRKTGSYKTVVRNIQKSKSTSIWIVTDSIKEKNNMQQIWNISDHFFEKFSIVAKDANGKDIKPEIKNSWYAPTYGIKQQARQIWLSTSTGKIITTIQIK
ncbi:MAG: alginate lyase family protein [Fimbriimonadaceae bacterium]|nr:alginate lyase family protein [Chitinophagales bacterium]